MSCGIGVKDCPDSQVGLKTVLYEAISGVAIHVMQVRHVKDTWKREVL